MNLVTTNKKSNLKKDYLISVIMISLSFSLLIFCVTFFLVMLTNSPQKELVNILSETSNHFLKVLPAIFLVLLSFFIYIHYKFRN